ncbi:Heavy metal tolerance protein [Cytospora mali]|uniref:Heavy metal tolerance protein n=1 Tax=Cytospora mali TaxID=578113 RepID=A0A194UW48_CYTMA|nr:Heavy metal tolerance protein [Valsa mali var. pyri (nom. inval.)]
MSLQGNQTLWQADTKLGWSGSFAHSPSSYIVPVVLSLPFLCGISALPAFQKSSILQRWKKQYDSFRHFTPFIIPTNKEVVKSWTVDLSIVTVCTLLTRVMNFVIPVLLRRTVDRLADDDAPLPIKEMVAFVLLRQIVTEAVTSLHWTVLIRVESDISSRLMCHLYDKVLSLSADYHDGKRPLDTYNTIASGGPRFARFVGSIFFDKLPALVDLVVAVLAFWRIFGGQLAAAMAAISAVYLWASAKLAPKRQSDFKKALRLRRERDDLGSDALRNWHTVAAFNNIEYEQRRHQEAMARSRLVGEEFRVAETVASSRKDLIMATGLVVLCLLASVEIKRGGRNRSVGDFVMLLQYWNDLAFPIQNFAHWMTWLDEFFIESDKMIKIMAAEPTVRDKKDAVDFQLNKGDIEFDNVSFSYDGQRPAVRNVSFNIEGGKKIAIVGETGGGKSTLLKLLCRTYDTTEGCIRVDGQDIRNVRLTSLMKHISIVPQIIGVFNATLLENLRYGNLNAIPEECEAACEMASLHKKIKNFTLGYEEKVGEKGTKLSGGELQRLAIARVLLRDSKIVLFDEAMSSLDSETEWKIQKRLQEWCVNKTVIIIAHRLATVAHADLILAVKGGVIVEAGRQEDLLKRRGYYFDLWNKQRLN